MPKSDPLRCSACNVSPRDEALPTSKLSLLAQQIQVWKFEFRIVARNSSGLVYRQKCRVPERSFTNHQSEHLPSRVAATKAAANVQQFVEVLKTEEEKWAMIPVGGSHTLTINKPAWIQDYLRHAFTDIWLFDHPESRSEIVHSKSGWIFNGLNSSQL